MDNLTLPLDIHTVTVSNAFLWNSTTTANQSEIAGVNEPTWVNLYLMPTISSLGLVGNSLSFIVMLRLSRHSSFYLYLAVLALSDCAVSLGGIIRWTDTIGLVKLFRSTAHLLCSSIYICNVIFSQFSSWVTVAVSVDRYIAVCHPFKVATYCTRTRAIITLTCIFLTIVALDFPMFCFEWSADYTSCVFPEKPIYFCLEYYATTDLPIYTVVPIAIISVLTLLIVRSLFIAAKRRRELANNQASGGIKAPTRKTIVLLTAVVLIFTMVSLPVIVVLVYTLAAGVDGDVFLQSHSTLFNALDTLSVLNHAANFVLYGLSVITTLITIEEVERSFITRDQDLLGTLKKEDKREQTEAQKSGERVAQD